VETGRWLVSAGGGTYDVSPDGQRFLMIKNAAGEAGALLTQLVVVQNFFTELERLLPRG
jgi:hypothetical protein